MDTLSPPLLGVYARECLAELRKAARLPQFSVPTIAIPAVFYGLFAVALTENPETATYSLATFGVFAATGPALFGFGAGVASERETGLIELKRVSPMPAGAFVAAKLAAATAMSMAAVALIYLIGGLAGGVRLSPGEWATLFAVHLCAVIPFSLIGFGVGMRLGAKGAVAIANALYLGFSIIGGLWMPVTMLPGPLQTLAVATPSFHLGQLGLQAVGGPASYSAAVHIAALVGMTLLAGWFAVGGWRRSAA